MESIQPGGMPNLSDKMPPPPSAVETPQVPEQQQDMVQFTVPVIVPREMTVADKDGKKQIDDFEVQLIPKNAIVTTKDEVQDLVGKVKEEALPTGMKAEIADSPAGAKVAAAKGILSFAAVLAGGFGATNLMGSNPSSWAAPVATVGGTIGVIAGAEGIKKAFDMKHLYEGMKARGQQYIQVPVKTPDGKIIVQNVRVDDLIAGAKDSLVLSSMLTVGSALVAAAGLGAGPMVAIASLVVNMAALLYTKRHALAATAKKVGKFLKDKVVAVKNRLTGRSNENQPAKEGLSPRDAKDMPALPPDMPSLPTGMPKLPPEPATG